MAHMTTRRDAGPMMKVTKYDLVTATLIAAIVGLFVAVGALVIIWFTNLKPAVELPPQVEILEMPGGSPDGAPDETLLVESPDPETDDPSLVDEVSEEQELMELLDNVMEVSDNATQVAQEQFETASQNSGKPGSASGTGKRPLGMGNGKSGFPREQRWFCNFDKSSLTAYARQIDFFKIELGALSPEGTLTYLSGVSGTPKIRKTASGKMEKRLYMLHPEGGAARARDVALFKKHGIDASKSMILQFVPRELEQKLLQLELAKAKPRKAKDILRTYFKVKTASGGYEFVVDKQRVKR